MLSQWKGLYDSNFHNSSHCFLAWLVVGWWLQGYQTPFLSYLHFPPHPPNSFTKERSSQTQGNLGVTNMLSWEQQLQPLWCLMSGKIIFHMHSSWMEEVGRGNVQSSQVDHFCDSPIWKSSKTPLRPSTVLQPFQTAVGMESLPAPPSGKFPPSLPSLFLIWFP